MGLNNKIIIYFFERRRLYQYIWAFQKCNNEQEIAGYCIAPLDCLKV